MHLKKQSLMWTWNELWIYERKEDDIFTERKAGTKNPLHLQILVTLLLLQFLSLRQESIKCYWQDLIKNWHRHRRLMAGIYTTLNFVSL